MSDALVEEMALHLAEPFPEAVDKGEMYGEVDPVMVGADIYGWASQVSLDGVQRRSLREVGDQLSRSLNSFPLEARPYYERLVRSARWASAK